MHPKLLSPIAECVTLAAVTVYQGIAYIGGIISDEDWSKITGPHGLVFVLIIGLLTLWIKSQRNDVATERRHKEALSAQKENFELLMEMNTTNADGLKALTVESIKANMRCIGAIESMDKNIQRLTVEMEDRLPKRKDAA